jgi:hypothetical protein
MKKSRAKSTPVANVVHQILDTARAAKTDGPHSGIYSRDAQLSGALTQAGTVLAKLDRASPPKRSSLLQNLFAPAPKPPRPRRSWFFASSAAPTMPDAKRIEQMLRAAVKGARPLVLDCDISEGKPAANSDIDCHLPGGAVDPVCTPR